MTSISITATNLSGYTMKKTVFVVSLLLCANATLARGSIFFNSQNTQEVVKSFMRISKIIAPPTTTAGSTECGYIFPNDPNKFGCRGVGPAAAADVAAACAGGGELACTGSGANRTCVCAFY